MAMRRRRELAGDAHAAACVQVYLRAYLAYLRAYERHLAGGGTDEPPHLPDFLFDGELWAEAFDVDPPRVTAMWPLLHRLPPLIPRCRVAELLPDTVSAEKIRLDERKKKGPRVRFKGGGKTSIVYPAPYLLEYLETVLKAEVKGRLLAV